MLKFLNNLAMNKSADWLAEKAQSPQAFDGGVSSAISVGETIKRYFRKYGTTEVKFEYHQNPELYIGYVKTPTSDEFLSVVLPHSKGSALTSYHLDFPAGQDFLSLMAKKQYVDDVVGAFKSASAVLTPDAEV